MSTSVSLGIKLTTLSMKASIAHQDQHTPFRQTFVVNVHLHVQTRFKFLYFKYADSQLCSECQNCNLNNFYPGLKFVKYFPIRGNYSHFGPVSFTQLELKFTTLRAMRKVAKWSTMFVRLCGMWRCKCLTTIQFKNCYVDALTHCQTPADVTCHTSKTLYLW